MHQAGVLASTLGAGENPLKLGEGWRLLARTTEDEIIHEYLCLVRRIHGIEKDGERQHNLKIGNL